MGTFGLINDVNKKEMNQWSTDLLYLVMVTITMYSCGDKQIITSIVMVTVTDVVMVTDIATLQGN